MLLLQLLDLVRLQRDVAPGQRRLQAHVAGAARAVAQHGDVSGQRDRDAHGGVAGHAARGRVDDQAGAGAGVAVCVLQAGLLHAAGVARLQQLAHLLGLQKKCISNGNFKVPSTQPAQLRTNNLGHKYYTFMIPLSMFKTMLKSNL